MIRLMIILGLAVLTFKYGFTQDDSESYKSLEKESRFSEYVDENGNISRPGNFRKNWVHLGTWFVKEDKHASGAGVHDVYATPESVDGYLETGEWPDGSVLVKTVSTIRLGRLTTGNSRWAGDVQVWFVMIRDRKNRFPDNEAWGEGWGWALFESSAPDLNLTKTWRGSGLNNCFGCHAPARSSNWVYVDGYPTLKNQTENPETNSAHGSMSMSVE